KNGPKVTDPRKAQNPIRKRVTIKEKEAYMQQYTPLVVVVVVVVHPKVDGSNGRVVFEPCRRGKVRFGYVVNFHDVLVGISGKIFQRFEEVGLEPEVEFTPQHENVSYAAREIVEGSEFFQQQGAAILQRMERGSVDDCTPEILK